MTSLSKLVSFVWIAASLLIVVFALLGMDSQFRLYYSNALQTVVSLAVAALCFRTMRVFPSDSPMRRVWGLIGGGVLAWGIGATIFAAYPLLNEGKETPFPSLADIGYLLTSPLITLALLVFKRSTGLVAPLWGKLASILVLAISFAIALWANWAGITGDGMVLPITAACYALFDPILLAVTVLTASSFRGGEVAQSWWFVLAGIVLYYIGNLIYNYFSVLKQYATGSPIDICWLLGFGLIAVAATKIRNMMA